MRIFVLLAVSLLVMAPPTAYILAKRKPHRAIHILLNEPASGDLAHKSRFFRTVEELLADGSPLPDFGRATAPADAGRAFRLDSSILVVLSQSETWGRHLLFDRDGKFLDEFTWEVVIPISSLEPEPIPDSYGSFTAEIDNAQVSLRYNGNRGSKPDPAWVLRTLHKDRTEFLWRSALMKPGSVVARLRICDGRFDVHYHKELRERTAQAE